MSKNPLSEIFDDKYDKDDSVKETQKKANDIIKEYLEGHHDAEGIEKINQFIDGNKKVKIDYKLVLDDKGNVFARRGNEFVKVYASDVDEYDARRSVSDTAENSLRKIAGEDGKIEDSEKEFMTLVEKLNRSGRDISKKDLKEAYQIISKDGVITSSEQQMFDGLASINDDLSITTLAGIGKILIHEKDAPSITKKFENSTGEVEKDTSKEASLFDRYKDSSSAIVFNTASKGVVKTR